VQACLQSIISHLLFCRVCIDCPSHCCGLPRWTQKSRTNQKRDGELRAVAPPGVTTCLRVESKHSSGDFPGSSAGGGRMPPCSCEALRHRWVGGGAGPHGCVAGAPSQPVPWRRTLPARPAPPTKTIPSPHPPTRQTGTIAGCSRERSPAHRYAGACSSTRPGRRPCPMGYQARPGSQRAPCHPNAPASYQPPGCGCDRSVAPRYPCPVNERSRRLAAPRRTSDPEG
jgi:hypothetical protein